MIKLIFTGSIFDLGGWHFTTGKAYDVHLYEKSVHYVISDNDKRYYIDIGKLHHPDTSLELVDSLDSNFMNLQKWRQQQLNKILYENNTNTVEMEIPKVASQTKPDFI